jgi:hypothetical protein
MKQFSYFCIFLILFTFFQFVVFQPLIELSDLTFWGTREIARGRSFWIHIIPHGPELTDGGYTLGPFLYFLLSIPAFFGADWTGFAIFKAALYSISISGVLFSLFRFGGVKVFLLSLVLFIFQKHLPGQFASDWSAAYAPPLVGLWFICYWHACNTKGREMESWWLGCFLIAAFGIQIHFNLLSLAITTIVSIYIQTKRFDLEISNAAIRRWILAFFLPFIPFFLWAILDVDFPGTLYSYHWSESIAAIRSIGIRSAIFRPDGANRWIRALQELVLGAPLSLALLLLVVWVAFKEKVKVIGTRQSLSIFVFAGISILFTIPLLGSKPRYYQVLFWVLAIVPAWMASVIFRPLFPRIVSIVSMKTIKGKASVFLMLSAILVFGWSWHSAEQRELLHKKSGALREISPSNLLPVTPRNLKPLLETIYVKTGWNCDQISKRVFTIGIFEYMDISEYCREVLGKSDLKVNSKVENWAGAFLMAKLAGIDSTIKIKEWLKEETNLLPEIREKISEASLELANPQSSGDLVLVPYFLKTEEFPIPLNNIGTAYWSTKEDVWLSGLNLGSTNALFRIDDYHLISLNFCNDFNKSDCRVGIIVRPAQFLKDGKIEVEFLGSPLGARMPLLRPLLSVSLSDIILRTRCNDVWRESRIISQIGTKMAEDNSVRTFYTHEERFPNYALAPFKVKVETGCKKAAQGLEVRVGRVQIRNFNNSIKSFGPLVFPLF